jgi:hypothetical protein
MIIEKCTLPIGIEHKGQRHRELEVRHRLVKDLVAAHDNPLMNKSESNYEICCLAEQIIKLGDIPKEEISAALLAEMYVDDFDTLVEAAEKARQRVASFSEKKQGDKKSNSGVDAPGV